MYVLFFQDSLELAKQINKIQSDDEFFKLLNIVPAELSYGTDRKYSILIS